MHWFKHYCSAHNDPFVFDIAENFGADGYALYFRTLEIYCDEFKPKPGWYFMSSINYYKRHVGIYHFKKLKRILSFISKWDNHRPSLGVAFGDDAEFISNSYWQTQQRLIERGQDPSKIPKRFAEDSGKIKPIAGESFHYLPTIYQKWFVNLNERYISIFIPNVLKFADEFTIRQLRKQGALTGQGTDARRVEQQSKAKKIKKTLERSEQIMTELHKLCRDINQLNRQSGSDFPSGSFVIKNLRQGLNPYGLRDGLKFLKKCLVDQSEEIRDQWALALSTAKTCGQNYENAQTDYSVLASHFGPFFTNQQSA
jgi:hypothetical protein